ncbi:non-hydrolyzing UDP-N-acetylglucosamine 2-epimerase [Sphingomonas abietis]|uniref:UDP-N-acetylglucosamine 2-epimerase (non-hydrolyzing) n=1 Tax=Sphingomonas abietis TaxID=3012344 RepID=A0ABY7NJK7_9SPHN|nr:UDP-N-acetylglucosamine 2-epimerase (non-hydrolyzing) [Sphingomonas abietis]WBO21513.1 UDP-N-acetylglucosamine 2-epimerase (non-hydrolyzing) [Sphingomonas abietis]
MGGSRAIRLLSVVGTRPEAIKIAPVALAAAPRSHINHRILATGQHGELFDEALADFGLHPELRLPPLLHDSSLDVMTARFADAIAATLRSERPDMVLVQGDTTSAYAGAIAAHRLGLPIGHVEAGLRSHDLHCPWPEERNRVMIDRLATLLFAPTSEARANLVAEAGVVTGIVTVTGNTGIDALLAMRARLPAPTSSADQALILLTCHRRENIGTGIEAICDAARRLADRGDVMILCPVHPNPAVGDIVRARLAEHPAITLTGALRYRDVVAAMAAARLILIDSGGIQEEAPALGIPVLVLRDVTERPEGLATGNLALVGTDADRIVVTASRLLDDPAAHAAMACPAFPFGQGDAATKILDAIEQYFSSDPPDDHPLPFGHASIMDVAR